MARLVIVTLLAVLSSACAGAREPLATPTTASERTFPRVLATARGERPPVRDLAPRRATIETEILPAAGGVAEQVFVQWQREWDTGYRLDGDQGILVWQASSDGRTTAWRVVYGRRYPSYLSVRYQIGDVTRDGHADVLVEAAMGSAGCGSRRMIATVAGETREILSRYDCEIGMHIGTRRKRAESGDLWIREPVGRCPYPDPSAHCFGGSRTLRKRWDGSRLVTIDSSVECVLPKLDPRRDCRPRQR